MQFQDVIFYVVSDDPIWAKPYFETSAASDGKTFYVGGQQSVDGHFQEIGETDLVGKKTFFEARISCKVRQLSE